MQVGPYDDSGVDAMEVGCVEGGWVDCMEVGCVECAANVEWVKVVVSVGDSGVWVEVEPEVGVRGADEAYMEV